MACFTVSTLFWYVHKAALFLDMPSQIRQALPTAGSIHNNQVEDLESKTILYVKERVVLD